MPQILGQKLPIASKNVGPFLAFTKGWFAQHQKLLLWLCNTPIIKLWFRWILRVHRDIPYKIVINELRPNCITYGQRFINTSQIEQITDFRTHLKFAKRLYFAFRPIWVMCHIWDWVVADRYVPELSFGFSSLTKYPDPDPETTTVDGRAYFNGDPTNGTLTFSQLRNSTGNAAQYTQTDGNNSQASTGTINNSWYFMSRTMELFDTSSLTSIAVVSAATFSVYGGAGGDTLNSSPDINVYSSNPASNTSLTGTDFNTVGTTAFSTAIGFSSFNQTAYNNFTLNSSGIAAVSVTSITKLGTACAKYDVANVSPTWVIGTSYWFHFSYADFTGTSQDPKLVVTYTLRRPLTGSTITSAKGSLGSKHKPTLTGSSITSAKGSLGSKHKPTLTGSSITSASGNLGFRYRIVLLGQRIISVIGVLSETHGGQVPLSGLTTTTHQGSIGSKHKSLLDGLVFIAQQGSILPLKLISLIGRSAGLIGGKKS